MSRLMTIGALALFLWPMAGAAQDGAAKVAEGAEVWANNCTRCHNARPSSERTDAEWTVIVNHMRARGNLTKTQARLATLFLQATNLPASAPMVAVGSEESAEGADVTPLPGETSEKEKEGSATAGSGSGTVEPSPELLRRLRDYLSQLSLMPPIKND